MKASPRRLFLTFALVCLAGTCVSNAWLPAIAAAQDEARDREARALFDAGESAYASGRYQDALERFRLAYEMSPRPELLYNIANASERLRHDPEALQAYREYLEALPDAENRAEVEARIAILEDTTSTQEGSTSSSTPTWAWVLSGAAVVFAGAALTTWFVSDAEFEDLRDMCEPMGGCSEETLDASSVGTLDTLTNVSMVLAIASGAGAVVAFVLAAGDSDAEDPPPTAQLTFGPAQLSLTGSF